MPSPWDCLTSCTYVVSPIVFIVASNGDDGVIREDSSNPNRIWRVNIGGCMLFGSIVVSDYYCPPVCVTTAVRGNTVNYNQI